MFGAADYTNLSISVPASPSGDLVLLLESCLNALDAKALRLAIKTAAN